MTTRPLLLSAPMVRATLAARWRVPQAVILRSVLPPALDAWEDERRDVDPTRAAEVTPRRER